MKKILSLLLCALLLTGCASTTVTEVTADTTPAETAAVEAVPLVAPEAGSLAYVSRFTSETAIVLSDDGITVDGGAETDAVYTSHDIVYYEDRDAYASGNPYGEGTDADKHTAEEAAAHTVVNITAPGAYRLSGTLSAGQLRIDLGNSAYEDPDAVVELILDGADITCTVAPAILFLNTYECDGLWSVDSAKAEVDTSAAGANLILENTNTVHGSYVARIYKDAEGEKKLWKQDGAIYSYMSMNVCGTGSLALTAENEGLDTELHLTINGGDISILSGNDGINTNEDGVSVTTINGGVLTIAAGLGEEGDGIDSNGYLVINGGIILASANPAADAGMDSDMGSYINGGTVLALGSTMDWAESDSKQVTMNLQFAQMQSASAVLAVTRTDGTPVFAASPAVEEILSRSYTGAILSSANLIQGESYNVYTGGTLTGTLVGGIADVTTVTGYTGGTQMAYSGTDVGMGGPGGMGGMGGRPGGMGGGMQMGEGFDPSQMNGEIPEGFDPSQMEGNMPEDFILPEGETMPADFEPTQMGGGRGQRPDGNMEEMTPPEGFDGEMPTMPEGGFGGRGQQGGMQPGAQTDGSNTTFYMNDMVNSFSGLTPV